MGKKSSIDQTLIAVYREQSAPAALYSEVVREFEQQSYRGNDGWRYAASAIIAVCIVTAFLHAKNQRATSIEVIPRLSLSLSTASLQPLPSLSNIRPAAGTKNTSLIINRPNGLTSQYRKTINLTNNLF